MSKIHTFLQHPGFHFSLFVFWLLSLPMGGPLLEFFPGRVNPALFLFPHISVLFLAWHIPKSWQKKADVTATLLCVTGTLLLLSPLSGLWLLPVLGITSAVICLRLCNRLMKANYPVASAALALIAANLLLFFVLFLQISLVAHTLGASMALFAISSSERVKQNTQKGKKFSLLPYLICLTFFHITFGLMYGQVLPYYNQVTWIPGIELLFYLLAIPLACYLRKYGCDNLLIAAIGFGMLAFSLLIKPDDINVLLSMFSLQIAAGFSDLFVLAWIIGIEGGTREFGYALGSVCTGILIGQYLSPPSTTILPEAVLAGNLVLSLAMLSLYLFKKKEMGQSLTGKEMVVPLDKNLNLPPKNYGIQIPANISKILSRRELLVLEKVLRGETYQNIAQQIEVTESTVKTYMGRIREKTGTTNKRELIQKIVKVQKPSQP